MSTGVDHVLPATRTAPRRGRLGHGRTWILASGDLLALTVAYVLTYVAADMLGPLPPVSAPSWFLTLLVLSAVPIWLAIFTGYGLYDADALQISVRASTRCAASSTRCSPGRSRTYPLAGRPLSLRLVGLHGRGGGAVHQRLARPRAGAARLDPLVGLPARHGAPPDADRGRRRGSAARPSQARRASRVRPRGRRVPRGRGGDVPGPVLGASGDVARLVDELEIDRVIIAFSLISHERLIDVIRSSKRLSRQDHRRPAPVRGDRPPGRGRPDRGHHDARPARLRPDPLLAGPQARDRHRRRRRGAPLPEPRDAGHRRRREARPRAVRCSTSTIGSAAPTRTSACSSSARWSRAPTT